MLWCALLLLVRVQARSVGLQVAGARCNRRALVVNAESVKPRHADAESVEPRHAEAQDGESIFPSLDDCAIVEPAALNLLACHFIAHHRDSLVEFVNECAFGGSTYECIDAVVGDLLAVRKLRFDVTGPLEPQNFFRCYEVSVTREDARSDLVYADLTLEYRNELTIRMDAMRHVGSVRGNSTASNVYRWLTTPVRGAETPLTVRLTGRGEGAAKVRLTLQTSQGVAFPRLAHVRVTDASAMRIHLEDYSIGFLGPTGLVGRFVLGQMPLIKLEGVVNDAIQGVLVTYRHGWPVMGGVMEERTGSWSRLGKDSMRLPRRPFDVLS